MDDLIEAAARAADRKEWSQAADVLAAAGDSNFVLDRRSWYLSRAKRYEEALELLAELRQRQPDHYRPYYMTGYQYYEQGDFRASIGWFDDAIQRNPEHLKSRWRRAYALHKIGEENKARVEAGTILRIWHQLPADAQDQDRKVLGKALYFLGRGQLRLDPAGAVPLLEQAAEIDPKEPFRLYQLAKALRLAGRPGEGVLYLRRARELKRRDVYIDLELATSLTEIRALTESKQILRGIGRACRGWNAFRAGRLCIRARDRELAISLLRRAREDRAVRSDPRLVLALEEALALPHPEPTSTQHGSTEREERRVGKVELIRRKRGFGFLVDEREGTRRHFRLPKRIPLDSGQSVTFIPTHADRGPAARDVRPA
jgi:tetratricopeptide (TPR) repeat protein/cold shock CspA family protein